MEIEVLDKSKKSFRFRIQGVGHSFCNALKEELWNDSNIDTSAYTVSHPLTGVPEFLVESKAEDPVAAIIKAVKRLEKLNDKTRSEFLAALR